MEEELELLLALVPVLVLEEGVMLRRFLAGVEEVEVRLRLLYKGVRLNQKKKRKQRKPFQCSEWDYLWKFHEQSFFCCRMRLHTLQDIV